MQPIELQPEHDLAIREHGRRAFPHECCGFLVGRNEGGAGRVFDVMPAVNSRGQEELHNRFTITPQAFITADKAARTKNLDIIGFYHSHPNAPARPSQYDLEHAWPVYAYVIVAVTDGAPAAMTSWVLREDRSQFDEQPIVMAPASAPGSAHGSTPESKESQTCP